MGNLGEGDKGVPALASLQNKSGEQAQTWEFPGSGGTNEMPPLARSGQVSGGSRGAVKRKFTSDLRRRRGTRLPPRPRVRQRLGGRRLDGLDVVGRADARLLLLLLRVENQDAGTRGLQQLGQLLGYSGRVGTASDVGVIGEGRGSGCAQLQACIRSVHQVEVTRTRHRPPLRATPCGRTSGSTLQAGACSAMMSTPSILAACKPRGGVMDG